MGCIWVKIRHKYNPMVYVHEWWASFRDQAEIAPLVYFYYSLINVMGQSVERITQVQFMST